MNKFAFFFPGQGSQSVGMKKGFGDMTIIRDTFVEGSDILGKDFWRMATEQNEDLHQTTNTQPLMLIAGLAAWRAWHETGGKNPDMMAGHSLGEYTALVAAGAIDFKDALPLVRFRAEVMQHAVPDGVGAMAAILGLDDETVRKVCADVAQDQVVEAVNLNSPGQVVVAGHKDAVERAMKAAKAIGAKHAVHLPVSVPSHCSLMKPAAKELHDYLQNVSFNTCNIPVLQNADVVSYEDPEKIKDALVRQLYSPVRWAETVRAMHALGITAAAECGPGRVFAGVTKRIVPGLPCIALTSIEALAEAKTLFNI